MANKIAKFVKQNKIDAIAFSGTSGAAYAYPLALKLNLSLICVRKSINGNHYNKYVEGCYNAERYIIVDDFIDTGATIRRILKKVKTFSSEAKCSGIFLYNSDGKSSSFEGIKVFK